MPAPISLNSGACSNSHTAKPFCASASAAARPPIPPGNDHRSFVRSFHSSAPHSRPHPPDAGTHYAAWPKGAGQRELNAPHGRGVPVPLECVRCAECVPHCRMPGLTDEINKFAVFPEALMMRDSITGKEVTRIALDKSLWPGSNTLCGHPPGGPASRPARRKSARKPDRASFRD
jgi:hypothetical protein